MNQMWGGKALTAALWPTNLCAFFWSSRLRTIPARKIWKLQALVMLACLPVVSGCAEPGLPQTPDQKIVASTLQFLASDGKFVCVDNQTSGPALAVFATTMRNRPSGMATPAWFSPGTLRPPAGLSGSELLRGARTDTTVHIAQPVNTTPALAPTVQNALNQSASQLSTQDTGNPVSIGQWNIHGVLPRWWPINRFATHCEPNYRLSNPVLTQNAGFITVIADHWATTYALGRHGTDWAVVGQWSNWLY